MRLRLAVVAIVLTALSVGRVVARGGPDRFDHPKHAKLFPSCVGCHAGAVQAGASLLPDPVRSCGTCHDGRDQREVTWTPRQGPRASNLAFDHLKHPKNAECLSCHAAGAGWLQVGAAKPTECFACHGTRTEHLAQADSTCGVCHRALPDVPASVTTAQVAAWPKPPSHAAPGFGAAGGHGEAAKAGDRSCATCHAQNFCAACHVNGGSVPAVARLGTDPRAAAIVLTAAERRPASHGRADFERAHAGLARASVQSCATCHTQASCTACHLTVPRVAATLATHALSGTDTAQRHAPPASHQDPRWESVHGALASARPQNCATCHARTDCLECHRADAAQGNGGYHPAGFLASHPAQAYGRVSSCSDCHNTQSFCQDCHRQAGVVASGRLQGGFHDSKQGFALNHGQAARQGLESCVSCHAERDCLACHSATRGRGFNPHGPGFDGDRLKKKNPGLCVACHAPGSV
ncbi:MAG TPA: cytochrome c3 family protein [Gemmatimonadales bacterium]|nr:cytochrome c3 family protein [Gemmatimonadales bacterium]